MDGRAIFAENQESWSTSYKINFAIIKEKISEKLKQYSYQDFVKP